jgi:hypothetical protein
MRLKLTEHYGLKFQMGKECSMYNPELSGNAVRTLYRLKRAWKRPMTDILGEMIQSSLKAVNKEAVCRICIDESNNQCAECYLK